VDTRKTIRKILFISMWLVIGAGMITLLAAAMRKQKSQRCKDYTIVFKGVQQHLFVDESDVIKLLKTGARGNIKGQAMIALDLRSLEQLLEKSVWIKDAELYFDNNEVLHITVTEREPIARIFTTTGRSFYIDNEEKQMPLSDKLSAKVPVFTGFPERKSLLKKDSALLRDVHMMATFISSDPFWLSQVSQIDITPDWQFEIVPVVGNHLVKFGKADNIEKKFNRLFVFYKNVLSQAGFDKYRTIDVQYAGQVIGVKGFNTKVDSIELRRSVEKLLKQSRELQNDSLITAAPVIAQPSIEASTETGPDNDIPDPNPLKSTIESKPVVPATPVKKPVAPKPNEKKLNEPKPVKKEPKAVMERMQ
jgi:cell division protein FtsQ